MKIEKIVLPENVYVEEFDVIIKPYLTVDEVAMIGDKMLEAEDYCEMIIAKDCALIETCVTDCKLLDGIEYNIIKHCGLMDAIYKIVNNIDDIDEYVKIKTSANVLLGTFLKEAVALITKATDNLADNKQIAELIEKAQELTKK
ncbi:MAG: hypothetical protein KBT27_04425 [Prevotellaceae bacterium]|nr:hypothetical protein [Candidatus Faecinaster equi]